MRNPRTWIVLLAVVFISAVAFKFLYAPGHTKKAGKKMPETGLGYHPPSTNYTPGAGIKNSPHDLSANSAYFPDNRYNPEGEKNVCIFCHLPHEPVEEAGINNVPLWNRASSQVTRFTPYNSGPDEPKDPNRRLSVDVSRGPGDVSKLCLSCHDGSIAVNRYGAVNGNVRMGEEQTIGHSGVLSNHHPIGFSYAGLKDKEIALDATLGTHMVDDLLSNGRMECTTCHAVHNYGNTGEKLLWISDRHSDLCCSCHLKC